MVVGLKMLCLHQLHRDLCVLDIQKHFGQVIDLIDTTFQNASDRDNNEPGVGQELRDLVVAFAAWNANGLIDRPDFQELIKTHGDFATEFMCKTFSRSTKSA
jgi:hypothetical protein